MPFALARTLCYNGSLPGRVVWPDLEGGNVASSIVPYLNVVQIIVSAALIVLVLLQAKGGGLSSIFGGEGAVYRTKRGLEKTLFNFTIVLAVVFGAVSLLSVIVARSV